jgi:hypothetical protein
VTLDWTAAANFLEMQFSPPTSEESPGLIHASEQLRDEGKSFVARHRNMDKSVRTASGGKKR